ncbi:MAG: helix-turn-helix domain-containing protein [Chloroflexi bacterium]|nr:helix-turn-helix domain-containing protein [Chloroflexota bacterium]
MQLQHLGQVIAQRRRARRWSQTVLADHVGISRHYLSLLEQGQARNPSARILSQLALALDLDPAVLWGSAEPGESHIPRALREAALAQQWDFRTVDRLASIPDAGREPTTAAGWCDLYQAIRPYLQE